LRILSVTRVEFRELDLVVPFTGIGEAVQDLNCFGQGGSGGCGLALGCENQREAAKRRGQGERIAQGAREAYGLGGCGRGGFETAETGQGFSAAPLMR
jgi:hypothetical protein